MATSIDNLGVQFRTIHENNWVLANAQDNIFYSVQHADSTFDLYLGKQLLSNQDEIDAAVASIGQNAAAIQALQVLTAGFGESTIKDYVNDAIAKLDSGTLAQKVAANEAAIEKINNETIPQAIVTAGENADTKIANFNTSTVAPLATRVTNAEGDIDALETTVGNATSGLVKEVADLKTTTNTHTSKLNTLEPQVITLIGSDTGVSARAIAAEEINTIVGGANDADTIENIKDLVDYVNENAADLSAVIAESAKNKTKIDNVINGTTVVPEASNADTLDGKDSTYFAAASEVEASLNNKANSADVYTKTETNELLAGKADIGASYTKTEADAKLATKANSTDVYTKGEVDTELAKKANIADVYTKEEANAELAKKANTSTTLEGYGITNAYTKDEVYTKTETSNVAANAANTAVSTAKTELIGNTDDVEGKTPPTLYSVKNYATNVAATALSEAKKHSDAQLVSALTWTALTSM